MDQGERKEGRHVCLNYPMDAERHPTSESGDWESEGHILRNSC